MELTQFESDLGMKGLHGAIVVNATIWDKQGRESTQTEIHTTVCKFHNAIKSKKRIGLDNAVKSIGTKGCLTAMVYRAKISHEKDLALYQKGCCNLGVTRS